MMRRQDWMREYFSEEGYLPISFVGRYKGTQITGDLIFDVAAKMRTDLGLKADWAYSVGTYSDALKTFKDAIENAGVAVVVNGIVNDNTHRKLSVEEFRGFVLADDVAPLVFVNGQDAKGAQIFTLAHEIGHLYFASTGVVSPNIESVDAYNSEHLYDAIAAEFLVPSSNFLSFWENSQKDDYVTIENACKRFKVSFMVCARKARDLSLIDKDALFEYYHRHKAEIEALPESVQKSGGGDYYKNKQYRLGNVFGQAVFTAVQSRRLLFNDAFRLTGLKANTFDSYFKGSLS